MEEPKPPKHPTTATPKPQSLLHIGTRTRDQLQELAEKDGQRWQDYARAILKRHIEQQDKQPIAGVAGDEWYNR